MVNYPPPIERPERYKKARKASKIKAPGLFCVQSNPTRSIEIQPTLGATQGATAPPSEPPSRPRRQDPLCPRPQIPGNWIRKAAKPAACFSNTFPIFPICYMQHDVI